MRTSVNLAGVELKNPVMTASGTFGSGAEYSEFVDLKELGAVVTKGVANVPWPGNPTPRIAEVYGGMLNAIGLQNPGIDVFCERDIPFLKQFDTKIVVNVCGRTTEDYCEVVERCRLAFETAAEGKQVAMICSGDAGVYGMAGLMYELSEEWPDIEIKVIPGVTAATGGAAVLGAPLIHDFALISLSDLLTPWEKIEKRLLLASEADFVICLYNPGSHKRADYLEKACDLMLRYKAPETVCGIVSQIGRDGETSRTMTLAELRNTKVDMFTTVFIGNSQTKEIRDHMVTPRGYRYE